LTSCAARVRPPLAPAEAVIAAPAALVRVPEVTASVVLTLLLLAVIRSRVPVVGESGGDGQRGIAEGAVAMHPQEEPAAVVRAPLRRWSPRP